MRLDTTNQDHYDIMAALRGPDGDSYFFFMGRCKALFTARIRYWVGCGGPSAGLIRGTETEDALIQQVLDSAPDEAPDWWPHYRSHVRYALNALLRMSPRSLQDFSPSEVEQLFAALDKLSAA